MSRLIKWLKLLVVIVVLAPTLGCDNDGSSGPGTQALTESDFSEDPSKFAKVDRDIVVDFLEPPGSEKPENDTGGVGIDVIPYRYKRTLQNTFCWKDDNLEAEHFMSLMDSDGVEVLRVETNGECVTRVIEEGDYVMALHHDGRNEITNPVFIIPDREDNLQASDAEGLINGFKVVASHLLKGIQNSVLNDARAQSDEDVDTLMYTGSCMGCDLSHLDLSEQYLAEANLSSSNLSGAILNEANLDSANLSGADLSGADLFGANLRSANLERALLSGASLTLAHMSEAKLIEANLSGAALDSADLSGADLSSADLSGAFLLGAHLERADLSSANLSGAELVRMVHAPDDPVVGIFEAFLDEANLSGATWCDGNCICGTPSIGACVGCDIGTCTRVCQISTTDTISCGPLGT